VEARLSHLLGEAPDPDEVNSMVKIVKRLQKYGFKGRRGSRSSSFDIDSASHQKLLKEQNFRCAVCGYAFKEGDLDNYEFFDHSEFNFVKNGNCKNKKKACLDHILPIYLAGDRATNWQVLCRECNEGKSDLLIGFEAREWFGHLRIKRIRSLSTSLRYMILKRNGNCGNCNRSPRQTELHVLRKDCHAPFYYWNLRLSCNYCDKRNGEY
jgi:5-methylcytosine-specific restriction endonuclease McrA